MNLPHDLKHFKADRDDSFVIMSPDLAIMLLCIIILLWAIVERFL